MEEDVDKLMKALIRLAIEEADDITTALAAQACAFSLMAKVMIYTLDQNKPDEEITATTKRMVCQIIDTAPPIKEVVAQLTTEGLIH